MRINTKEKRVAGFTLIELVVVVGIFSVMLIALAPFVHMVRDWAHRVDCANNLRRISLSLHRYALDNADAFPAKLGDLYPRYATEESIFDCPGSKHPGTPDSSDFEYVPALTEAAPESEVIVYDLDGNHGRRGRNILRVGGAVDWVKAGNGRPR